MAAWAKNEHLGFEVFCVHRGVVRKYRPDFLIRLQSGDMLVLEAKGRDSEQNRTKRRFLDEWGERYQRTWRLWPLGEGCVESPRFNIQGILSRHVGNRAALESRAISDGMVAERAVCSHRHRSIALHPGSPDNPIVCYGIV